VGYVSCRVGSGRYIGRNLVGKYFSERYIGRNLVGKYFRSGRSVHREQCIIQTAFNGETL
jgi:hypothetical protein